MEEFSSALVPFEANIAVLYGGMSNEREVSLRSGKNCFEALKRLGYKNTTLIDVDKNISNNLIENNIEYAFLALHGRFGEDGCIQGLLEILGIKYTGCGVKASAICMDKEFTKRMLETQNLPIIKSLIIDPITKDLNEAKSLRYPVMVKPASEGSSIGMSKVNTHEELKKAVEEALKYDKKVMVEEFVEGISMTVGVLENKAKTIATPILQFRTKTEWYDYEAKYTEGLTEFILPAEIPENTTNIIKDMAIKAHKSVDACGVSRVDFILNKENKPFILEINTIPGMTDLSDLPAQSKCMGIEYDDLVQIILNSTLLSK